MRLRFPLQFLLFFLTLAIVGFPQSPNGTISGLVLDPSGSAIADAQVLIVADATGIAYPIVTNNEGLYTGPNLPPGRYRIQVSKMGFKTLIKPDVVLNVQGAVAINFTLPIGAVAETVTVSGGAPVVNTESAAVSTVVDRQFAENLPMNGRSFQTLIELTPGVNLTVSNSSSNGQFSVNGQRASSNYWMVDGVSANIGIGSSGLAAGNGLGGAAGAFSVMGGTNGLVSVDALQEFRIQTSTYAPEFGRTPGGQIGIVTRSGTNVLHGTLFDYFRNDVLDANDWFANLHGLPKPQERQNDFGGTFSGPVVSDHTFFFFSYEGLRLRLPQVAVTNVPDIAARQSAIPAIEPYLNAFPIPNGSDDPATGIAKFQASFSNASTLDAYSLRVDHHLNSKLTLFGRYNYSPSALTQRGILNSNLSSVVPSKINTQTATFGVTDSFTPNIVNDARFNYSRTTASSYAFLDDLGGAVPLSSLPFPSSVDAQNAQFAFFVLPLGPQFGPLVGPQGDNQQRQINVTDTLSVQNGNHALKFGVDFRRLSPHFNNPDYAQFVDFRSVALAAAGKPFLSFIESGKNGTFSFKNLGVFAQDTWRVTPKLVLTYGARWDLDFSPSSTPSLLAVTGFNLSDFSQLALAPAGTPVFRTTFGNVAPRLGINYELSGKPGWQTALRGGVGTFFDLATQEVGNNVQFGLYPFGATAVTCCSTGDFPLDPTTAQPPAVVPPGGGTGVAFSFDPKLKLPYVVQWNLSVEQGLGAQQALSASYIGSIGRRLIQTANIVAPNANFSSAQLVTNASTSDYDALQLQFHRRLSSGLQVLTSYAWAHSIDTASAGSLYGDAAGFGANGLLPGIDPNANRGASDFDIRNAFSGAITYDLPRLKAGRIGSVILDGWSFQSMVQARSALPVNVYNGDFFQLSAGATTAVRPDVVPDQPLTLKGSQYPGGMAFNPAAFTDPPLDVDGNPLRQGNLERNHLRGFGAVQWDFSLHRDFLIREPFHLQFRAEMFNLLNHPNFAPPLPDLSSSDFGRSIQMLGSYLGGGNVGGGGLSSLYQLGGPRSIQLALKLQF